jgi:pimeloyl-ACP methyl ester carboxylesterase
MKRSLVLSLVVVSGCSLLAPREVGVDEVDPTEVHAVLNETALDTGRPSALARRVLYAFDLDELYVRDRAAALVALHQAALEHALPGIRYGLAELHYVEGLRTGEREHYLAAAVYAFVYLMGDGEVEPPSPFQRRFRWACELYNRGLEAALRNDDGNVELAEGVLPLPVGEIRVTVDRSPFPWEPEDFPILRPADDFDVWGLRFRLRDSGLGVPLVCISRADYDPIGAAGAYFPPHVSVPATAFLHIEGSLARMAADGLTGRLELHSAFAEPKVLVGGRSVPLESDLTAALAYTLDDREVWEIGVRAFFQGDEIEPGLEMTQPYSPGKTPVVLVHGTASSPASWAEMINFLQVDPGLRDRFQFWTYRYASGLPVVYSAAQLRATLDEVVRAVDPEGNDAPLRNMVLIGHSQGGLLVKLTVVHGRLDWFERATGDPFEDLSAEHREVIRPLIDFEPSPHVDRVVFIGTPHGGSFLSDEPLGLIASAFVQIPRAMRKVGTSFYGAHGEVPQDLRERMPTAVEGMRTDNPFLFLLRETPIADAVRAHSIIAIEGDGPAEEGDDGVVTYRSAHLEGVESEFIVRYEHSCQSHPPTILEVRRILLEHLEQGPSPSR